MPQLERFLHEHAPRWKDFEQELESNDSGDPDRISRLFIELTDDLSYVRTFFPDSDAASYLNRLAARAHQKLYTRRRESRSRFRRFWTYEVPLELAAARTQIAIAFAIFILMNLVGLLSTMNDADFARSFFGDLYVNTTLENIANGDPMGIYGMSSQIDMFFHIGFNNLQVSALAFVLGAFFSIGTLYVLINNGIMVGTFLGFLAGEGVLFASVQAIFIHGTVELVAIVIAAAAGFVMGNSLLAPRTHTRGVAFQKGAMSGLKIFIGLVPFIFFAAFLESFVTRYYLVSPVINFVVIGLSLALVVWYFYLWPRRVEKLVAGPRGYDPDVEERPWATADLVEPVAD